MLFGQWAEPTAANGTRIRRVGAMDEATGYTEFIGAMEMAHQSALFTGQRHSHYYFYSYKALYDKR